MNPVWPRETDRAGASSSRDADHRFEIVLSVPAGSFDQLVGDRTDGFDVLGLEGGVELGPEGGYEGTPHLRIGFDRTAGPVHEPASRR